MEEIIGKIVEDWFLSEPTLFATYCTHTLKENTRMIVPMRCGKMKIEYNPEILKDWDKKRIEERLKYEVIRILLGHPYQRQPYKATKGALGMASDVTLSTLYSKPTSVTIPSDLKYDKGLCFEEYYKLVKDYLAAQVPQNQSVTNSTSIGNGEGNDDSGQNGITNNDEDESDNLDRADSLSSLIEDSPDDMDIDGQSESGENGEENKNVPENEEDGNAGTDSSIDDEVAPQQAESAELWEEDQLGQEVIREVIARSQRTKQWGSLSGHLSDIIEASIIVRIDYRRVLSWFRATVLSSKRMLTRMRPSRRYGFQNMGIKREFCTRLLVAIDVSGSVSKKQVSQALAIINRFFKYGIENIDVIQFDAKILGDSISMKKASKSLKISGRGGTDFQEALDYFVNGKYDGLIMITDGYAEIPTLPDNASGNILWMIYDDEAFRTGDSQTLDEYTQWIATFPRSRYIILPPA